jgi:hypothetical protein
MFAFDIYIYIYIYIYIHICMYVLTYINADAQARAAALIQKAGLPSTKKNYEGEAARAEAAAVEQVNICTIYVCMCV